MYVYICIYIYIYICIYMFIHIYIYTYIYISFLITNYHHSISFSPQFLNLTVGSCTTAPHKLVCEVIIIIIIVINIYICMYIHIYVYIYIYKHIYMYICIYIYIYISFLSSLPSLILTVGSCTTAPHKLVCEAIFESVGVIYEVPEKMMDGITGLSGSGPACKISHIGKRSLLEISRFRH
jgi:hypothetical protein